MRLLFITDTYPPLDKGGFAQLCHDLAHELRGRGHEVTILCAGPTPPQPDTEPVIRRLMVPVGWGDRWPVPMQQVFLAAPRSRHNLRVFKQVVAEVRPEAILLWPTGYVDQQVMAVAESLPGSVAAYYIAGVSPTDPTIIEQYWANPGYSARARVVKRLLRRILNRGRRGRMPLRMEHVMCVSDYERRRVVAAGIPMDNTHVVYNGIDPAQFPFRGLPSVRRQTGNPLRVLYAGRLVETKGGHTAVEAVGWLRRNDPARKISLTLLGAGDDRYVQAIDRRIADENLMQHIVRQGWIPRNQIPDFMAGFDVLVLPTIHPEPLARVVQEAMALGLNVIATPTGGTPEIVQQDRTGLLFPAGDAAGLATCLQRLESDISLCDRLAASALALVKNKFTMQAMGAQVEEYLLAWKALQPGRTERRAGP